MNLPFLVVKTNSFTQSDLLLIEELVVIRKCVIIANILIDIFNMSSNAMFELMK